MNQKINRRIESSIQEKANFLAIHIFMSLADTYVVNAERLHGKALRMLLQDRKPSDFETTKGGCSWIGRRYWGKTDDGEEKDVSFLAYYLSKVTGEDEETCLSVIEAVVEEQLERDSSEECPF